MTRFPQRVEGRDEKHKLKKDSPRSFVSRPTQNYVASQRTDIQ